MALKDLIAQKSALTEEAIEYLVKNYVRYDPDELDVAFTPEFASLGNKAKVLVYLVAVQGWEYVIDGPLAVETKPADLEEKLGITGGSLRPLLKDLKDRHLVVSKGTGYSVRPSHLAAVKRELDTRGVSSVSQARPRRSVKKGKSSPVEITPTLGSVPGRKGENSVVPQSKRRKVANGVDLSQIFNQWISDGFFNAPKTLRDVQNRFHEEAILIPQTSVPKYLLRGVRGGRLARKKQQVGKKEVWIYQTKN
jgi:hypothetical protein